MEFTMIHWIYLGTVLIAIGIIWTIHREWKMECKWRSEDNTVSWTEIEKQKKLFSNELTARREAVALNTEVTLQRDNALKALKIFGDVYRGIPVNTGQNMQGCICEMTGDGIKPLTDIKFVAVGHYERAGKITAHLSDEDSA